uniref:TSA: Wollemia nobilis Ref_Wollemi_Transcript_3106_2188 transcribed RNA sequence n=1 Tax=Wollemia nobilis TaxID=56998 RepID=A0A0C9QWT1_9CONI
MGYLSCRADSAVITCDSYKKEKPLKVQLYAYKDLESATGGFAGESLLGKGSHGCVYRGVLGDGTLVAVKKPSTGLRILQDDTAVENEIEILSKLHSPRLVNLLGFSHDTKEKLLVVEFMSNGTLHDILHCNPEPPSWARRVHLALQTAKAVFTLHSANPPVIHRDIKSSNVLIDANWNARLGDFGLALRGHVEDIKLNSTPPAGTIGYLDPGYTTPGNLSTKNDVFSFGILLLEIISGRNAIDVQYSPPSIVDWAMPLIRQNNILGLFDPRLSPPKNLNSVRQMALIAARCIRSTKEKRPSMKEVVEGLKVVSRSIPLHIWNGLSRRKRKPNAATDRQEKGKSHSTQEGSENFNLTLEMKSKSSQGLNRQLSKPVKSLGRVSSRSSRVSDEDANKDKEFNKSGSVVRRGRSGRILVDLFNETTETETQTSESKSIDWHALAKVSSPSVRAATLTLRQAMLVRGSPATPAFRSGPLPVFGDHYKEASAPIVRNPSVERVRKPRVCIDPTLHYKQIPQVTHFKVVAETG